MSKATVPYKARLIMDGTFGERLRELPPEQPIWIVDTPVNRSVALRLRDAGRADESHVRGITTFTAGALTDPAADAVGLLGTIDLHHGESSVDPPYSVLEIIGCGVCDRLRQALSEFGFAIESSGPARVVAVRTRDI